MVQGQPCALCSLKKNTSTGRERVVEHEPGVLDVILQLGFVLGEPDRRYSVRPKNLSDCRGANALTGRTDLVDQGLFCRAVRYLDNHCLRVDR